VISKPTTVLAPQRPGRPCRRALLAMLAVLAVVISACGSGVHGRAVAPLEDPFGVGGLPAADGPSGLRENPPAPQGTVLGTDGGPIDALAQTAINDIEEFWTTHFDPAIGPSFLPIAAMVSFDARDPMAPQVCGEEGYKMVNAFYCIPNRAVYWDRGVLFPTAQQFFGPMAVVGVLAHEYGHALQEMGPGRKRTSVLVAEQQADCLAGVYLRWVAEDNSSRFTLSTSDGLTKLLAALITSRDPILTPDDDPRDGHGTALDRIAAVQTGFVADPATCMAITLKSVQERRGSLPITLQADPDTGRVLRDPPITEATVTALVDQLGAIFTPARPPTLTFTPAACPDATATPPVSYCPATHTIAVDLPALQKFGEPADEFDDLQLLQGANTAWTAVTSRYAVALQHTSGLALDTAATGLRTACLTGVAQRHMAAPQTGAAGGITLVAGNIDEAIAGLLTNGLAAADANGAAVPAGFTRIGVYRAGLSTDDPADCYTRFP